MADSTGGFRNIVPPQASQVNTQEQQSFIPTPTDGRFRTMNIGYGNLTMKSDERGTWWGSDDIDTAPIAIYMNGSIVLRQSALTSSASFDWYDDEGNLAIHIGF